MISRKEHSVVITHENHFKVALNQTAKFNIRNGSKERHFYDNSLTPFKLLHRFVTFTHKKVCLQHVSNSTPPFLSREINM